VGEVGQAGRMPRGIEARFQKTNIKTIQTMELGGYQCQFQYLGLNICIQTGCYIAEYYVYMVHTLRLYGSYNTGWVNTQFII
jgi:hypothetical protein